MCSVLTSFATSGTKTVRALLLSKWSTEVPRFTWQLVPKKRRRKLNIILLMLSNSMFLTRNLKKFYKFTVIPRITSQLVPKNGRRKLNIILLMLLNSTFLTRNLKKFYKFAVIPLFTWQLVPKKGDVNRSKTQIDVRGRWRRSTFSKP